MVKHRWSQASVTRPPYVICQKQGIGESNSFECVTGEPYVAVKNELGRVKRRTSHEPNRMQMRETLCTPSLSFISIRFETCEVQRLTPALVRSHNDVFNQVYE